MGQWDKVALGVLLSLGWDLMASVGGLSGIKCHEVVFSPRGGIAFVKTDIGASNKSLVYREVKNVTITLRDKA